MSNTLAIILATCIIGGLIADQMIYDGAVFLFLARKFADLTEWMAFWR